MATYPSYTDNLPNLANFPYNADPDSQFEYGGFKGLHDMASGALRGIFGDFEDFDGFRLNPNDLLDFSDDNVDFNEMVRANTAPLVFASFGLIFAFILTVFGIIWCVGKLCCCGSSKPKPGASWEYVENRFGKGTQSEVNSRPRRVKNSNLKVGLGILLLCWMVIFLTFLIGLFMTNSQLRDSIGDLPDEIDNYLEDGESFISNTKLQIDAVMKRSFTNLSDKLLGMASCPPKNSQIQTPIYQKIQNRTNIVSMDRKGGRGDRADPVEVVQITLSELEKSITEIVQLLTTLRPKAQLPPALQTLIAQKESIEKVLKTMSRAVDCDDLRVELDLIGAELTANANEMNEALDDIPIQQSRDDLEEVEDVFDVADTAIFYSVTGLNVILLGILVVITAGTILVLMLPDNRIGSILLNSGLLIIFILGWLIWCLTLGLFFISGAVVVVMPGAFENIANNGSLVNSRSISRAGEYVVPTAPHILNTCKDFKSAYVVFELVQVYNVTELDALFEDLFPDPPFLVSEGQVNISRDLEIELNQLDGIVPNDQIQRIGSLNSKLESNLESIRNDLPAYSDQVGRYVDFAKHQVENKLGSCEPLSAVLNSTIHTFSYKLGSPIGSYWFGLNFIFFLFFPIVITAVFFLRQ